MPRSGDGCIAAARGGHGCPPLGCGGDSGHAHTWWPCPGQQSDSWSCFRRAARMHSWRRTFKTVSSDELVMMCGAQRAHQCSGSVAHDALPPSLRWQASFQRVPHGQAAGMRCQRQAPVQLADAKLVEAFCSSRLSELPITSGKVAEHTGMASEASSSAGTTSCPRCPYAVLGMGKRAPGGVPREPRRRSRAKTCSGRSPTDTDRMTIDLNMG